MKPQDYIDRLSTHLKQVIARAIGTATAMAHTEVTPTHLLFALSEETGSVGATMLQKVSITPEHIKAVLETSINPRHAKRMSQSAGSLTTALPELNAAAKHALEKAMLLAYEHEHTYIGTEHLLHGLINIDDAQIAAVCTAANVLHSSIQKEITVSIESTNRFPDMDDLADTLDELQDLIEQQTDGPSDKPLSRSKKKKQSSERALDVFSVELTSPERVARLDPVIGRETEIERMIHILARRTKNNPVLVGEPGVGKTAIVEGLAKRIAEGTVPPMLRNKKIFALDLTLMISGTMYRGEFEARIKQVMEDVRDAEDTILFIDEIHTIIGAGSNQGTMDAANILKPALARGELRCIGATTLDEYQKYITTDPALARRFQSVTIAEPTPEAAVQILSGIATYYNTFHHVDITTEAIKAAVELSCKYIHDNFLPDKAIDLMDEAAAAVRVATAPSDTEEQAVSLKATWNTLQKEKEAAIVAERFDDAMRIKKKIESIETALESIHKQLRTDETIRGSLPTVTEWDIARVLGARIGQAPNRLIEDEWELLAALPERLATTVIGQSGAIDVTVQALKKGYLGLRQGKRPIASLLFTGPSGTGKTHLAKSLAEALYHDPRALVRLDMTEFAEAHGVSKLLGSPAGYVGYNERNKFLDTIRTRPYSVVLFDEFDKAHRDVRKLLLQILDEGRLTDSTGRIISFEHTIVILTANIGTQLLTQGNFGFGKHDTPPTTRIEQELREHVGAELLGRLSGIGIFTPLSTEDLAQIASHYVSRLSDTLQTTRQLHISIDQKAIDALLKSHLSQHTGVRQLEQRIDTLLQDLIIQKLSQKRRKSQYTLTTATHGYKLI